MAGAARLRRRLRADRSPRRGHVARAAALQEELTVQDEAARLGLDPLFVQGLRETRTRQQGLESELADVSEFSQKEVAEKAKSLARFSEQLNVYDELAKVADQVLETEDLARSSDDEMAELAREEAAELRQRMIELRDQVQLAMLPVDPLDEARAAILEIRPAAGGDEASLWADDLLNMYTRYCELEGLACKPISVTRKEGGGITEASLSITGEEVYSKMKFESGVHRVQRIPSTETAGRIHTSTATVVIMPEPDESEIQIDEKDIDFKYMRAGGKGGQNVNKVETKVHAVHIPTGIQVVCKQERSRMLNKNIAIRILGARLMQREVEERNAQYSNLRRSQVGSGDRSEKVRTYNFKENRCSDHRLSENFSLANVIAGNLQEPVRLLRLMEQQERLKELEISMRKPST